MVEVVVEQEAFEPLDLKQIACDAAKDFGLSLMGDMTYWTHPGNITAEQVFKLATEAALENATTAVSQKLGKQVEAITGSVDLLYSQEGALADFDAVIATYAKDLKLDFSTWPGSIVNDEKSGPRKATWDDKIMAVRTALNTVLTVAEIESWVPPLTVAQLLEYRNTDPRLKDIEGLGKAISALNYPGSTPSVDPTDPGDPPAFMDRRNKKEDDMAKKKAATPAASDGWDDPAPTTVRYWCHAESGSLFTTNNEAEELKAAEGACDELDEDQYKVALQQQKEQAAKAGTDGWDDAAPAKTDGDGWDEPAAPATPHFDGWDDPAPAAPANNKSVRGKAAGATGTPPKIGAMLDACGITNDVMAVIMSNSGPYISMLKSGKRRWPGMTPEQVVALRFELDQRKEAIAALEEALDLGTVQQEG